MKKNKLEDLTNKKFGRLTVLKKAKRLKSNTTRWECICECGKVIETTRTSLIRGHSKSCGCLARELFVKRLKKTNKYVEKANYYEVFFNNCEDVFYIDKDDYKKIKDYCWSKSNNGYVVARNGEKKQLMLLHNFIMGSKYIDHRNRNRLDNRKENLRNATSQQNNMNKSIQKNNKSGVVGVFFDNKRQRWIGSLTFNNKKIMKRFKEKNEAILFRKKLEEEYFKDFSPNYNYNASNTKL